MAEAISINAKTGEVIKRTLTEEEVNAGKWSTAKHWERLRFNRDRKLQETDGYASLSDRPITDAMKTYRQQLRDLPANTADPSKPTWPTEPGG
tara:strand:- start:27 stop:305 length:279 start_codon:yes stop_codon:yes gene_type:complete